MQPEAWFIERWSAEAGRGMVRSRSGARLEFDAAYATVGAFFVGEEVRVRIEPPSRVVLVEPVHSGASVPRRLEATVSAEPTGYLALRRSETDLYERIEDLAWERLGSFSPHRPLRTVDPLRFDLTDYAEHGFVFDAGPDLRAIAEEVSGRPVDALVKVSAVYPFSWEGHRDLDALFASIATGLPGYDAASPAYFFASASASRDETPPPPHLWWSIEPHALLIGGVLPRLDWTRWQAAFELETAHLQMRLS